VDCDGALKDLSVAIGAPVVGRCVLKEFGL
jgi:hypothetical protein